MALELSGKAADLRLGDYLGLSRLAQLNHMGSYSLREQKTGSKKQDVNRAHLQRLALATEEEGWRHRMLQPLEAANRSQLTASKVDFDPYNRQET